jgi:hypothetical protein
MCCIVLCVLFPLILLIAPLLFSGRGCGSELRVCKARRLTRRLLAGSGLYCRYFRVLPGQRNVVHRPQELVLRLGHFLITDYESLIHVESVKKKKETHKIITKIIMFFSVTIFTPSAFAFFLIQLK